MQSSVIPVEMFNNKDYKRAIRLAYSEKARKKRTKNGKRSWRDWD